MLQFIINIAPDIKWCASSRWPFSLCCHMRNLGQMTIGKTRPTLGKEQKIQNGFSVVGAFFCEGAGGLGPIIFGLFCTTLGLNPIRAPPLK